VTDQARTSHGSGPPSLLALDTATSSAVLALADADGCLLAEERWPAGHRHGEELLARIDRLLDRYGVGLCDLAAIAVGTGPGAFTGLRVGLATAKGIAHACGIPILGVATSSAILRAASLASPAGSDSGLALILPAGPSDRILVDGSARLLPAGGEPTLAPGTRLVAIDLVERAPADAVRRGEAALAGLGAALVSIGLERLAQGDIDDLARLVPEYVTLPRGVDAQTGEIEWSLDPH